MDPIELLEHLERAAAEKGIRVRYDRFDPDASSKGGLCILEGLPTILLNGQATTLERISVLAKTLADHDLDDVSLPPAVRKRIFGDSF